MGMVKGDLLIMFKKKYKAQTIIIAQEYLMGIIDFEQLVDILIKNDNLLKCFISCIRQKIGRMFPSKEKLMIINNTYWQRHDFYNIMYSYLFVLGIKVDEYAPEYYRFKQLEKVCPKWFQADIIFLENKFKNLYEIIKTNQLEAKLTQICKCENNKFPIWLQGPMWPIIDNEPAIFVRQSKLPNEMEWDDIEICYYFKDLKGNEIVVKEYT